MAKNKPPFKINMTWFNKEFQDSTLIKSVVQWLNLAANIQQDW